MWPTVGAGAKPKRVSVISGTIDQDPSNVMSVTVEGHTFQAMRRVEGKDFLGYWNWLRRDWERTTLAIIRKLVGPEWVFIDVGAWIGFTPIWAALHGAEVHAFEPDPVALAALRANIDLNPQLNSRVTIIPAAAGDSDRNVELFTDDAGNSETSCFRTVQRNTGLRSFDQTLVVPQVDLVSYMRSVGADSRRMLLKMDIEGGEFALLPHIHDFCLQHGVVVMVTLHPANIVLATADDTGAARIMRVSAALERYVDFGWYDLRDDTFQAANKVAVLKTILNNLARDHSVLMSPRPLP